MEEPNWFKPTGLALISGTFPPQGPWRRKTSYLILFSSGPTDLGLLVLEERHLRVQLQLQQTRILRTSGEEMLELSGPSVVNNTGEHLQNKEVLYVIHIMWRTRSSMDQVWH